MKKFLGHRSKKAVPAEIILEQKPEPATEPATEPKQKPTTAKTKPSKSETAVDGGDK